LFIIKALLDLAAIVAIVAIMGFAVFVSFAYGDSIGAYVEERSGLFGIRVYIGPAIALGTIVGAIVVSSVVFL
jgi:hypothetical protein